MAPKARSNPETKREPKKRFCIQAGCKLEAVTHGYCRLHYIFNWKHIKFDRHVKAERRLNAYVDRLAKKYPKDFLEKIKEGLEDEEKFRQTVEELDLEQEPGFRETETEFLEKFLRGIKGGDSE
jgi:hypothetical protein